jgi:hypothetical protein
VSVQHLSAPLLKVLALSAPLLFAACSPKTGTPVVKAPPDGPFIVSDYFAASGAMGDGATAGNIVINTGDSTKTGCKERPDGAQGLCYSFDYIAGPQLFAGVYWLYPANNWGAETPLPINPTNLTKVTFQAAVEAIPDGQSAEIMKFEIGGVGLGTPDPKNPRAPGLHNDQFINQDTFNVTTDWQQFSLTMPPPADPTIPITTLVGAFAWYANYPALPDTVDPTTFDYSTLPPKTIYIDDVRYE